MKRAVQLLPTFYLAVLLSIPAPAAKAQDCAEARVQIHRLAKTSTNDFYAAFLINNVYNFYGNNGDGSFNTYSGEGEGFEWPKGSGKTAVFEDGLVWVCSQNGTLKVGGSGYFHGLQAGKILANGSADDPALPKYRIYRVRPDVGPTTSWNAAMKLKIKTDEGDIIRRNIPSLTDSAIYIQYLKDWNEWPASDGAPYTDVNGNGVYDPSVDIPGVPGADQTLWHVSNDRDATRTNNFAGTTPIGLEIQRTIWGYNRPGVFGNTIFTKYRILNKSGTKLDSMYIGQWSDPDLGGALGSEFDVGGCDTLLNFGYDFYGREINGGYGFPPPAFGQVLIQGPVVSGQTADSAVTPSGWKKGFRNLPMTAFEVYICGLAPYIDPISAVHWYNAVRGLQTRTGLSFIDPTTGRITPFNFSGDPVTNTGWLSKTPGGCTMVLVSGPFTFAAADSQDIVVASTIAQGVDRLSSVTALKSASALLKSSFRSGTQVLSPPAMSVLTGNIQPQSAQVTCTADCKGLSVKSVDAVLRRPDKSIVATIPLFDDGAHNDGQAGDGVFAATAQVSAQSSALTADANVVYNTASTLNWSGLATNIVTAGPVSATSPVIFSDNLNSDGIVNPGEDVRFGVTVNNGSTAALQNLSVTLVSNSSTASVGSVNGSSTLKMSYDPNNEASYLTFVAPSVTADSTLSFSLIIKDPSGNRWTSSVMIPVQLLSLPLVNRTTTRVSGLDGGDFDVSIVDATKAKDHRYTTYGLDAIAGSGTRGYRLVDSSTGVVLIDNHPLPDPLGHTSPVVDGFKLLRGTVDTVDGKFFRVSVTKYAGVAVSPAVDILRLPWTDGRWSIDATGAASSSNALSRLDWQSSALHDFEIRVTSNDAVSASEYYLGTGGALSGFQKAADRIPLQIWDVTTNTRLIINVIASGKFDTTRSASVTTLGSKLGWSPIYASSAIPYQEPLPQTSPTEVAANTSLFGRFVFADLSLTRYLPPAGTVIRISSHHKISSADSWAFNPAQILAAIQPPVIPQYFSLSQNYPNPFNPSTSIRFELAQPCAVKLRVFNVLGQLITTLVDEQMNAGYHQTRWNPSGASSGVYFYRLEAGELHTDEQNGTVEVGVVRRFDKLSAGFAHYKFGLRT